MGQHFSHYATVRGGVAEPPRNHLGVFRRRR